MGDTKMSIFATLCTCRQNFFADLVHLRGCSLLIWWNILMKLAFLYSEKSKLSKNVWQVYLYWNFSFGLQYLVCRSPVSFAVNEKNKQTNESNSFAKKIQMSSLPYLSVLVRTQRIRLFNITTLPLINAVNALC